MNNLKEIQVKVGSLTLQKEGRVSQMMMACKTHSQISSFHRNSVCDRNCVCCYKTMCVVVVNNHVLCDRTMRCGKTMCAVIEPRALIEPSV